MVAIRPCIARLTQKPGCLPSPEGLLEGRATAVASMDTCLHAHGIGVSRRKTTDCAQKLVFTRLYSAGLLGTATLNIRLVALNNVVFLWLLQLHPNASPGDINEAKIRRC